MFNFSYGNKTIVNIAATVVSLYFLCWVAWFLLVAYCVFISPLFVATTPIDNAYELKIIESQSGLCFEQGTQVLNSTDRGSMDVKLAYRLWTVFSHKRINLPKRQEKYLSDGYLHLDMIDAVEYIERNMRGGKIVDPISTDTSSWTLADYLFDVTVVHSSVGDYLVIERFREN